MPAQRTVEVCPSKPATPCHLEELTVREGGIVEIAVTAQGREAQVEVLGIIDESGAEEMKRMLERLASSNVEEVAIDFQNVTFIGSAGIGKLLAFHRSMSRIGGGICLLNVPKEIRHMFTIMSLDKVFKIASA
jgi:anti-anti-sigma factor